MSSPLNSYNIIAGTLMYRLTRPHKSLNLYFTVSTGEPSPLTQPNQPYIQEWLSDEHSVMVRPWHHGRHDAPEFSSSAHITD